MTKAQYQKYTVYPKHLVGEYLLNCLFGNHCFLLYFDQVQTLDNKVFSNKE